MRDDVVGLGSIRMFPQPTIAPKPPPTASPSTFASQLAAARARAALNAQRTTQYQSPLKTTANQCSPDVMAHKWGRPTLPKTPATPVTQPKAAVPVRPTTPSRPAAAVQKAATPKQI